MAYHVTPPSLSEADLNGLVDGCLDASRQADLLQRIKANPADQGRVDAWREQNELIRATFSEIEAEPVPVSLNLSPPPRLRCVVSEGHIAPSPPIDKPQPAARAGRRGRSRFGGLMLGLLACASVGGTWVALDRTSAPTNPTLISVITADQAEGTFGDRTLGDRTIDALTRLPTGQAALTPLRLPTASIPDLGEFGFSFTGATVQPSKPPVMLFFYESAMAERIAIGISTDIQAKRIEAVLPSQNGRAATWHRRGNAFAMAGTVDWRRLNAVATSLQADQESGAE